MLRVARREGMALGDAKSRSTRRRVTRIHSAEINQSLSASREEQDRANLLT